MALSVCSCSGGAVKTVYTVGDAVDSEYFPFTISDIGFAKNLSAVHDDSYLKPKKVTAFKPYILAKDGYRWLYYELNYKFAGKTEVKNVEKLFNPTVNYGEYEFKSDYCTNILRKNTWYELDKEGYGLFPIDLNTANLITYKPMEDTTYVLRGAIAIPEKIVNEPDAPIILKLQTVSGIKGSEIVMKDIQIDIPEDLNIKKYDYATELLAQNKYSDAAYAFEALEDYKDSNDKYLFCEAKQFILDREYSLAVEALKEISDNTQEDYAKLLADARVRMNYEKSKALFEKKDYENASMVLDFPDKDFAMVEDQELISSVEKQRQLVNYSYALECIEKEDYKKAIELLEGLKNYSDSSDRLIDAQYQYAVQLLNDGVNNRDNDLFYAGEIELNKIKGYKDTDEIIEKVPLWKDYIKALKTLGESYEEGLALLEKLPADFNDSGSMLYVARESKKYEGSYATDRFFIGGEWVEGYIGFDISIGFDKSPWAVHINKKPIYGLDRKGDRTEWIDNADHVLYVDDDGTLFFNARIGEIEYKWVFKDGDKIVPAFYEKNLCIFKKIS